MKEDKVFRLIKSLSQAEKRHFRVFSGVSGKEGEKDYMRVFGILDSEETYPDKKLKEIFKGDDSGYSGSKRLADTKEYLWEVLLRSLRIFHEKNYADMQIRARLSEVQILFKKELLEDAEHTLIKAKELASLYGKTFQLFELYSWEYTFLNIKLLQGIKGVQTDKLKEEWMKAIEDMRAILICRHFYTRNFIWHSEVSDPRTEKELESLRKIIPPEDISLPEPGTEQSFMVKSYYYYVLASCHYIRKEFPKAYAFQKSLVELTESMPEKVIRENLYGYLTAISNLLLNAIQIQSSDAFYSALKKLRSVPERITLKKDEHTIWEKYMADAYRSELEMMINMGKIGEGIHAARTLESSISISRPLPVFFDRMSTYWILAYFYFASEEYSRSLLWINRMLQEPLMNTITWLENQVRIMNLLIHYELGNNLLLESEVKSLLRLLYRKERLFRTESILLNFIRRKIPLVLPGEDIRSLFRELKKDLEEAQLDPLEKEAFSFDFISWLESKISGRKMADIIREKAETNK